MATAKPIASTPPPTGPRRSRARLLVLVLAALVAGVVAWFWHPVNSHAVAGASYGARMACSCRFIEGRPLSECRKDFEAGMGLVTLSEDEQAKTVTARFPLLARQTATFVAGQGCVPQAWAD